LLGGGFQAEDIVQQRKHTMKRLAEQHYPVAELLACDTEAEIHIRAQRVFERGHSFEEDFHCLNVDPNLQSTKKKKLVVIILPQL
jgi:hypothetical protein